MKKSGSLLLCFLLLLALITVGCGQKKDAEPTVATMTAGKTYGTGAKSFAFSVTDPEGNETAVTVKTDKQYVGEALLELGLIAGEDSSFGLYVKTVNGVTLDYDKDGKYWALYVDGEYALTGVDTTEVVDGSAYAFVAESYPIQKNPDHLHFRRLVGIFHMSAVGSHRTGIRSIPESK